MYMTIYYKQYRMCYGSIKANDDGSVWLSAFMDSKTNDHLVFCDIHSMMYKLLNTVVRKDNVVMWFHHLSFAGSYIINYFMNKMHFRECSKPVDEMENNTYKYLITDKNDYMYIVLKFAGHVIEFRDSYKILPYSIEKIRDELVPEVDFIMFDRTCSFNENNTNAVKHELSILNSAVSQLTSVIGNDLTIGSSAFREFLKTQPRWNELVRQYMNYNIDCPDKKFSDVDQYIRYSYDSGLEYMNEKYIDKKIKNGCIVDVNSMHNYVMHSSSNFRYPIGDPHYHTGKPSKQLLSDDSKYYFIRLKTRFYIKQNRFPCIHIQNDFYRSDRYPKCSDVLIGNNYSREYTTPDGRYFDFRPELVLTKTDYELLVENYHLYETEYIDYIYFDTEIGIFDEFINKYYEQKQNSTGINRQIAKMYLVNLYGKIGSKHNTACRKITKNSDGSIHQHIEQNTIKTNGSVAIAAAIVSYTKKYIISVANANYKNVLYIVTDALHLKCKPSEIKNIELHDTKLGAFKIEHEFSSAWYHRPKAYIVGLHDNNYFVKWSGMTDRSKTILTLALSENIDPSYRSQLSKYMSETELEFANSHLTLDDIFMYGVNIPGHRTSHSSPQGCITINDYYNIDPIQ